MNILLTGHNGFIGSHVYNALDRAGHSVHTHPRGWSFDHHSGAVDLIVHCAAAAGPWHTLEDIWRDNIHLTQSLVQFAQKDYTPIIFTSSISVYGEPRDHRTVIDETSTICDGASYYGSSKQMCELMLKMSEVSFVSLRLPAVIGPNASLRNWLPNVARKLLADEVVPIHHAQLPFNNVVHVTDLANFIVELIAQDFDQETFCLSAGSVLSVQQTIELLANCLNVKSPKILRVPSDAPHFTIDHSHAENHGYSPMSLPKIISRFATDLLDIRAQTLLDIANYRIEGENNGGPPTQLL